MKILKDKITLDELKTVAEARFGDMVKAVVDVERELVAIDAELHSDLEALLLEDGSRQKDLWGINLYPDLDLKDLIEFDSMINMRPSQGNRSRGVDSAPAQKRILDVVNAWIKR